MSTDARVFDAPREGDADWVLRFLGGAMKGRTIALERGTSTLGSAAACEVMLPEREVPERHLVFEVGSVAATVQRVADAPASLNGQALGTTRRQLAVGDRLEVGAIGMQVDRTWPAVDEASEWGDSILPPEAASLAGASGKPRPRARHRQTAAALLLLLAAAVLGAGLMVRPAARDDAASHRRLAELERAVTAYPEVRIVLGSGGQVGLQGIVETRARRESLVRLVADHGVRADVKVQTAEDLVEQARRYLGAPDLSLAYAGGGRLVVSGTIEDESVRERIRRLGEDLHPMVLVADKLEVRPKSQAEKDAQQRAQWAAWQGVLPARIVGITEDAHGRRYLQLANGSRYYEGAVLRSGAELTHIGRDRLVVTGAPPAAQGP